MPPLADLGSLRRPLQRGERVVLDFFDAALPEEWEIYIHPHLNGLEPDFVLLHPRNGIAVYEVKDWDLTALTYSTRVDSSGHLVLQATDGQRVWQVPNPVEKVYLYRDEI